MSYRRYATLAVFAAGIAACATTQGGSTSDTDAQAAAPADTNPGAVTTGNVALTDTMSAISQPRPMAPTAQAAQGDTVKGEATDLPAAAQTDTAGVLRADSASGRTTGVEGAAAGGAQIEAQLDTTITAAQRGLTSLAPSVAVGIIDSFKGFLSGSGNPALTSIAGDLDVLRAELAKPTINGPAVGQVLTRLGGKTAAVAPSAGILSERVASLGQMLLESGNRLSSGN